MATPVDAGATGSRLWLLPVMLVAAAVAGYFYLREPEPAAGPAAGSTLAPPAEAAATPSAAPESAASAESQPRMVPLDVPPDLSTSPSTGPLTADASAPSAGPRSIEDVVGRASAAVVSIETATGRGTGFFVKPDTLVTNAHVVQGQAFVTIRLHGGQTVQGQVLRSSTDLDIAIVRATAAADQMQVLQLGSASAIRPGQEVLAIGSPMGLQNTVTRGIVSAVREAGGVHLIQTDAAINPGNSGGPLLDREGRVIGINTLKLGGRAESLGFAVAVTHAVPLIEGRSVATGLGTAQAPSLEVGLSGGGATADSQRQTGDVVYEKSLQQLAQRADQIDAQWKRLQGNCLLNAFTSDAQRSWFVLRDQTPSFKASDAPCAQSLADIRNYVVQFSTAMAAVQEDARRAGVYPGTMREARRRHRLDWSGWDR
ncbi:MAG TPA: trypsin-like peptidase domain-containing protein [Vicinamibacterales bacterium]|nr:trypsin-like peptidase domain-containing protein [Vicinamibacterales bacterium]